MLILCSQWQQFDMTAVSCSSSAVSLFLLKHWYIKTTLKMPTNTYCSVCCILGQRRQFHFIRYICLLSFHHWPVVKMFNFVKSIIYWADIMLQHTVTYRDWLNVQDDADCKSSLFIIRLITPKLNLKPHKKVIFMFTMCFTALFLFNVMIWK